MDENPAEVEKTGRRVRHQKYGTGTVVKEDETTIQVEFENYGKKEFVKAFSGLEAVED